MNELFNSVSRIEFTKHLETAENIFFPLKHSFFRPAESFFDSKIKQRRRRRRIGIPAKRISLAGKRNEDNNGRIIISGERNY